MSLPLFTRSALTAAILSLGLAVGASAQGTAQQPSGGTAATPAPPASGSTGMDKGAGTGMSGANAPTTSRSATADKSATLSGGERRFIETAARHGMAEVELGKLAQDKASHPQVKEFGKRMAEDHGKANEELKKLAAAKGVTLPTEMDRSHKRLVEKLAKKSGNDFDREYMDEMEDDHGKDVREFRSMAKNAKDADVKAFASATLPTLEQHLQLAKSLEEDVKQAGRKDDRKSTAASSNAGRSAATATKDASTTSGAAGMPSSTARSTTQPAGGADGRTTTSPSK